MFFGSWCRAGRIEDETDKNGARKVLFKRNTFNEDRICMCHARYCTGKTQYFNQIMHARAPSGAIVCIYVQFPIWIFTELFEDFSNPVPPEISEFKIVFPTWGIQDYSDVFNVFIIFSWSFVDASGWEDESCRLHSCCVQPPQTVAPGSAHKVSWRQTHTGQGLETNSCRHWISAVPGTDRTQFQILLRWIQKTRD